MMVESDDIEITTTALFVQLSPAAQRDNIAHSFDVSVCLAYTWQSPIVRSCQ